MGFALALFVALSLNLFLCFGMGVRELITRERVPVFHRVYPWCILFASSFLSWLFFDVLFNGWWVPVFLLRYPFVLFVSLGLEKGLFAVLEKAGLSAELCDNPRFFAVGASLNGFSLAAAFLVSRFAFDAGEALFVSLAFAAGSFAAYITLKEIQKRSYWEILPRPLRGAPILLISMGLLSMMVSEAALLILKALEG
jgi:electron transport complex protein RnfA